MCVAPACLPFKFVFSVHHIESYGACDSVYALKIIFNRIIMLIFIYIQHIILIIMIDSIDWEILRLLQNNARITNIELSKAVGLSPSPTLARVKALEKSGHISRYVTLIDSLKVGLKVSVFINVALERQVESALERFEESIKARPEVMECYLMTGEADYLIRVVVADIQVLEAFILNFLSKIPGVGNIKSSFALKQVKYKTALPLPGGN